MQVGKRRGTASVGGSPSGGGPSDAETVFYLALALVVSGAVAFGWACLELAGRWR